VISRDPRGERETRFYFTTDPTLSGLDIVLAFMARWSAEVTFEESRAHLGIQTKRQWSDAAIERSTPCLLALYSLVTLCGSLLYPKGDIPPGLRQSPLHHTVLLKSSTFISLCGIFCTGSIFSCHIVKFSAHSFHFKRERREEAKRESNLFAEWRNLCRQKRNEEATVETITHCNNHPFVPNN